MSITLALHYGHLNFNCCLRFIAIGARGQKSLGMLICVHETMIKALRRTKIAQQKPCCSLPCRCLHINAFSDLLLLCDVRKFPPGMCYASRKTTEKRSVLTAF